MTEALVFAPVAPAVFDAEKFRQTTRAQWENTAEAWNRWGPLLARWLGPATEAMLDMAAVRPGARVLDVAAGAGEQTLVAARRVGVHGHVLATDISPAILRHAKAAAGQAGLANVDTLELDGERHDLLPGASFDAAISRVGLIYFPDQQRALAGIRHALKPGGRFAAVVYSTADRNPFFALPVGIIRRRAQLPLPHAGAANRKLRLLYPAAFPACGPPSGRCAGWRRSCKGSCVGSPGRRPAGQTVPTRRARELSVCPHHRSRAGRSVSSPGA